MLRMEIALFLVMAFVAAIYYSAGRRHTPLHRTFAVLLGTVLVHLLFDAATLYTVNHLDAVPRFWNDTLHRLFIGTMVLVVKINTNRFRTKLTFRKSVIRLRNPVIRCIFPLFTVTYP